MTYTDIAIGLLVGAGAIGGLLWAFMGPNARTLTISHLLSKAVIHLPHDNKQTEFKLVKRIDKNGDYHFKDRGKPRIAIVEHDDVSVLGGKVPIVTVLDKYDISAGADKAKLAEIKKRCKDAGAEITWGGTSVSWETFSKALGRILHGPFSAAAMYVAALEANRPLEEPGTGIDAGVALKVGIIILFGVLLIAGVWIAKSQGYL